MAEAVLRCLLEPRDTLGLGIGCSGLVIGVRAVFAGLLLGRR
jgi:hypothetical protein